MNCCCCCCCRFWNFSVSKQNTCSSTWQTVFVWQQQTSRLLLLWFVCSFAPFSDHGHICLVEWSCCWHHHHHHRRRSVSALMMLMSLSLSLIELVWYDNLSSWRSEGRRANCANSSSSSNSKETRKELCLQIAAAAAAGGRLTFAVFTKKVRPTVLLEWNF